MSDGEGVAREFVSLALRLDRCAPGSVGAFLGDPVLLREIAAGPEPDPAALARQAGRLADRTRSAGLDPHREAVLLAQLTALGTTARRLAGQTVSFRREVELCLGVSIAPGEEDDYRAAHRELAEVLPGRGRPAGRMARLRHADELAPDRLAPAVAALTAALRERASGPYRLPVGESVGFEMVDDAPWAALHRHGGVHRSVVRLNRGARLRAGQLVQLVAHEVYPGHHTELCRMQDGPQAAVRHREHEVSLVLSPCSVVSEGLADTGLLALVGPGWGRWAAEVLAEAGVRMDGELVERVERVLVRLQRVRQDAALLLHDRRAGPRAAVRHLRRWLLVDDRRAQRMLTFLTHPVWRAYTSAYVEGHRLVGEHLGAPGPLSGRRHAELVGRPSTPDLLRADVGNRTNVLRR